MLRLRGKALGGQISLGSATVLRAPNGIPMLPARLVAQMARAQRDSPIEPVEIVVVARDYGSAASLALPWARVVGIVAEHAPEGAEFIGVPTVVGLEGLMEKVDDDALMLIDGERGIVLVEPDGTALAAYQAERERIAPRRRIYLDYSHQPAVSLDGRQIRVLARVTSLDEVRQALDNGADTLYVPAEAPFLGPDAADAEHLEALTNIAEAAAGKPITIEWDVQVVSASAVLQAARRAEITLTVPLNIPPEDLAELPHYLQEAREELLAEDIDFADVRLAGVVAAGESFPEDLGGLFISRVAVTGLVGAMNPEARAWLEEMEVRTRSQLLPLEMVCEGQFGDSELEKLALGVDGIVVRPSEIGSVKNSVRTTDFAGLLAGTRAAGSASDGDL